MSSTCVKDNKCAEHPDSIEKINWKCVECGMDMQADYDRVIAEREAAALKRAEDAKKDSDAELSEAEIAKRRALK